MIRDGKQEQEENTMKVGVRPNRWTIDVRIALSSIIANDAWIQRHRDPSFFMFGPNMSAGAVLSQEYNCKRSQNYPDFSSAKILVSKMS